MPCLTSTFFHDVDGDGFGGSESRAACVAPGPGWTMRGGDCNDRDARAFPGQTKLFDTPTALASFDFDCSGKEEEETPTREVAGPCTLDAASPSPTCIGSGSLPAEPARTPAAGIDPLCGSTRYQACRLVTFAGVGINASCIAVVVDVPPIPCR